MRAQQSETRLHGVGDEKTLRRGRKNTGYWKKRHGVRDEKTRGTRRKDLWGEGKRTRGSRLENTGLGRQDVIEGAEGRDAEEAGHRRGRIRARAQERQGVGKGTIGHGHRRFRK